MTQREFHTLTEKHLRQIAVEEELEMSLSWSKEEIQAELINSMDLARCWEEQYQAKKQRRREREAWQAEEQERQQEEDEKDAECDRERVFLGERKTAKMDSNED